MRRLTVLLTVVLALWMGFQASGVDAQGPNMITACQTISQPGAYVLANNLTASGDCLAISADFVTIDLSGFLISGDGTGTGIVTSLVGVPPRQGIAVRNGSISNFRNGVELISEGSIIEALQVFNNSLDGINAFGIARNNTAVNNGQFGIIVRGIVTNNYAAGNDIGISGSRTMIGNTAERNRIGISAVAGSTVTSNTAVNNTDVGISVTCPSNVIGNTATNNPGGNLLLNGEGCKNINNVAP